MASVRVSLMATAAALLIPPTGAAAAAVNGHRADLPPHPPVVVTDAHHAALAVHAGAVPLVLEPASTAVPTTPAPAPPSLRRWLDLAVIWAALLGLAAGGVAIGRTHVLQERSRGGV